MITRLDEKSTKGDAKEGDAKVKAIKEPHNGHGGRKSLPPRKTPFAIKRLLTLCGLNYAEIMMATKYDKILEEQGIVALDRENLERVFFNHFGENPKALTFDELLHMYLPKYASSIYKLCTWD